MPEQEQMIIRLAQFMAALERERLLFISSNGTFHFTQGGNRLIDGLLRDSVREALHRQLITEGVSSSVARLAVLLDAGLQEVQRGGSIDG